MSLWDLCTEIPGEPSGNPVENGAAQFNGRELLAMALAGIHASSEGSDKAINKPLHVALNHREALQDMAEGRKTKKLYTKRLRPMAVKRNPQVFSVQFSWKIKCKAG